MSLPSGGSGSPGGLSRLLPPAEDGTEEDGGDSPAPPGVAVLSHSLAALGAHLGCRLECFGIGRTARAVVGRCWLILG